MAGSINDFKTSFKGDLARPSRFDVQIPVPLALAAYVSDARDLTFKCESTELPGKSIATMDRKMGSAPIEKLPYLTNYNEIALNFIVGDNMRERLFFEAWLELINPTTNYNFRYKSDYTVDVNINQYSVTGQLSYALTLLEAFPISINDMSLDWSADGYHKVTVSFAFTQWKNNVSSTIGKDLITTVITPLTTEQSIRKILPQVQ